jgi:hypothetical protein
MRFVRRSHRNGLLRKPDHPQRAQAMWSRLFRHELYLDEETEPFAIGQWITLNRISIMRGAALASKEDPLGKRRINLIVPADRCVRAQT